MSREVQDPADAALATAVRELGEAANLDRLDHPSADELLAYHEDGLSSSAIEALQEHLAVCPECAQKALDLALLSAGDDDESPTEPGDDGWSGLREDLAQEGLLGGSETLGAKAAPLARSVAPTSGRRPSIAELRRAYAVAALFFTTTLLLGVGLALEWQVEDRSATWAASQIAQAADPAPGGAMLPQANRPVVELRPIDTLQRSGESPAKRIVGRPEGFQLILSALVPASEASGNFRLEMVSQPSVTPPFQWSFQAMKRQDEGDFTVALPGGFLTSGAYSLSLFYSDGRQLHEYQFIYEAPPAP
ncbi:MAG: hypothetical protein AAF657_28320 [Acidobacteriota bacterium]